MLSDLEISENMPYLILMVQRKNIYIHIKYIQLFNTFIIYKKKKEKTEKNDEWYMN